MKRAFGSMRPSSRRNYYAYFKVYCEWAGKTPQELWAEPWEVIRDRIIDFRLHREEEGKAPNTISTYTSCIRRFYEYNNIIFKGKFFSNGKAPRARESNEKELITPVMLSKIMDLSTPLERSMFILQFQSGLGAYELCNLKIKNVGDIVDGKVKLRIEDGVIKLKLIRQKTDVRFTTFFGTDAIDLLRKWIDLRQSGRILLNREISEDAKIKSKNDHIFIAYSKRYKKWGSIQPVTYAKYLRNKVRQLGWISDDDMRDTGQLSVYRPHALRMSFSEILKHQAFVSWDFVEYMLGHKMSNTDRAYVKFDDATLMKVYKEGEVFLSLKPLEKPIVSDDKYRELKRENEVLKAKFKDLESDLAFLRTYWKHADASYREREREEQEERERKEKKSKATD